MAQSHGAQVDGGAAIAHNTWSVRAFGTRLAAVRGAGGAVLGQRHRLQKRDRLDVEKRCTSQCSAGCRRRTRVYCLYTYRGKHAHNTSSGNHSATDARDGVFRAAGIGRTDVGLTPSKSRVCVDSFVVVFGEVVPIYNQLLFLGASEFASFIICLHSYRLNNNDNNNNKTTVLDGPGLCIRFCRAQGAHNILVALRTFDPLSEIGRISVKGIGCYGRNAKEYSSLVSKSAELHCLLLDQGIHQGKYLSISPPSFFDLARYVRSCFDCRRPFVKPNWSFVLHEGRY